jgi:hypothetical protein
VVDVPFRLGQVPSPPAPPPVEQTAVEAVNGHDQQ